MDEKTWTDGGPAFPCHTNPMPGRLIDAPEGMKLRDYFAAVALPALQARYYGETECGDLDIAGMAYDQADAMLQRRVDPDSPPPAHYRNALAQIATGATGYSDNDTTLANIAKRALGMEVDE